MKTKVLNVRVSDRTIDNINLIRDYLINQGFDIESLTDSFIVRYCISTFKEKMKYLIFVDENDKPLHNFKFNKK